MLKALILVSITIGMLGWSDLQAQSQPTQKKTSTRTTTSASPSQKVVINKGEAEPQESKNTESKQKEKGSTVNFGDGSVRFKAPTEGTSATPKTTTNTAVKKKKKSKPSLGGVSDGTSNTIMIGETSTSKKSQKPSKVGSKPARVVKRKK